MKQLLVSETPRTRGEFICDLALFQGLFSQTMSFPITPRDDGNAPSYNSERRGSKAARNSSIGAANPMSKLSVNKIRNGPTR